VEHQEAASFRLVRGGAIATAAVRGDGHQREVTTVSVLSLRAGESPRLAGEDKAHIARLAEAEVPLPPILVDRRSMRVIDGMHRLLAASLKGRETIEVEFFDGSSADAFLRAVEANVTHGLPLSQADRRAAAARIIVSHPYLSDRAIGVSVGLAAKTVAAIRRHSGAEVQQLTARVGRDGKVRPLDGVAGRRRAAELMAQRPQASLREIARAAGVSPATAGDVRRRLARGEEPVASRSDVDGGPGAGGDVTRGTPGAVCGPPDPPRPAAPSMALAKLLRDPSLRHNDQGRWLLRLLQHNAVGAREWSGAIAAVPPHCTVLMVQIAHQYAQMWLDFAQELDERVRVIDPRGGRRLSGRS
jgi:hypothetical protein